MSKNFENQENLLPEDDITKAIFDL
jgi:hypothetical protein